MPEATNGRDVAHDGALRVEDLFFLDDLRALGVPWIDRLIDRCASHEDVEMAWALIHMGGPDAGDADDVLELSARTPPLQRSPLEDEARKLLGVIRVREGYRS